MPAHPSYPIFDHAAYCQLFSSGDPDGRAWLADFLSVADVLMTELQAHYAANQREKLAATARRLSGTALSAGAVRLGATCRALGQAADRGGLAQVSILAAAITAEFGETVEAITRLVNEIPKTSGSATVPGPAS